MSRYTKAGAIYTRLYLSRTFPGVSPESLGYYPLERTPQPETGPWQTLDDGPPEEYEPGKWRETWRMIEVPIEHRRAMMVVSRFQARAALHLAGLLPSVEALMAGDVDPIAKLAWEDAQEFKRMSPTILALSQSLGLTDAQLDALFDAAMSIDA